MITREPIYHVTHGGTVMEARDDISLLRAVAQSRDQAAFKELYERHRERAFNYAFQILQDSALAQDAVQEAMLSIWLSAKLIPPEGDAVAWILGKVSTKSQNLRCVRKRRAKREERAAMERGSSEPAVAENVERKESIAALRNQINELPELERTLVAFCYGASMTHRKIGELVGIPHQRVTEKIQQALDRLRAGLTKAGVAAVVPLVSAQNLFEAMTTGHECPPGLASAMVMSAIASSGTKAAKSGGLVWIAGTIAVVAAGAAIAWTQGSKPAPVNSVAHPDITRTAEVPRLEYTVTLQEGLAIPEAGVAKYAGTNDSHICGWQDYQDMVRAADSLWAGESGHHSPLIGFAVFRHEGGPLADDAEIFQAILSLYKIDEYGPGLELCRVLRPWKAAEVTWNSASKDVRWSQPGGDCAGTPAAASQSQLRKEWCELDVTESLREAQKDHKNYGWSIRLIDDHRTPFSNIVHFCSSRYEDPALAPKLVLKVRRLPAQGNNK
jgi:RNA polymerase sigma-70 factor (ECF subfamily)